MYLMGLDVGTTGCKAVVFDDEGRVCGRAVREYGVQCDAPGMAEQDAEAVWRAAVEVLREALGRSGGVSPRALSLSVQGDAIIPVDRNLRPLHPAILGMDYRSAAEAEACEAAMGGPSLFERTGMRPHPMNSLCKLLWLRAQKPGVVASAWKVMTYGDYVIGRLTGRALIDHTMASRTMAFDLSARTWSAEVLGRVGVDAGLLSEPVASGVVVGPIAGAVAGETGLPPGVVVVSGGHDQTCAALGAGVVRPGVGVVSTGTAEVLSTAFSAPVLSRRMYEGYYPCYLHAKPGMYFTFALNHVGGILLRWWRDQFGTAEVAAAAESGRDPYAVMDERMPDGPSPVFVVPHLQGAGTPLCDLEARGAIVGLSLATTRHDVAKALLEGLTFELRSNLETLRACGIEVGTLIAVGGGARSVRWLQLKADILGRPVRALRCPEAACLGAALIAGTAVGAYGSLDDAVKRTVVFERDHEPVPGRVACYDERFAEYSRLYAHLKAARSGS